MGIEIRSAMAGDAEAIAGLHAASWRSAYRGAFSDAYLDGDLLGERRRHWNRQFATGVPEELGVFVAVEEGACVGFICVCLEGGAEWGPLLDNLHVRPDRKGRGIGRRLIEAGRAWVRARGGFDRWHLWVVETNAPARRVYEHLGWVSADRKVHQAPDGTPFTVVRYTQKLG